jgi:predicted transcriptional regulator of viral defense system
MRTADALGELQRLGRPVVSRGEAIARFGVRPARASQILKALQDAGLVTRLGKGLWLVGNDVDPFSLPPYLTSPYPAYVSMWSALSRHGMIEQIPRQVFVASLDRPRQIETPVATYSVHHLAPEVFGGYTGSGDKGYIATPEKALFDTVYVRAARRGTIHLPELEFPEKFDRQELAQWTERITSPRLKTIVQRELSRLVEQSE